MIILSNGKMDQLQKSYMRNQVVVILLEALTHMKKRHHFIEKMEFCMLYMILIKGKKLKVVM